MKIQMKFFINEIKNALPRLATRCLNNHELFCDLTFELGAIVRNRAEKRNACIIFHPCSQALPFG
jgi:hypothetical protein